MANYLLDYSKDSRKFLESLPAKQYRQVGKKIIDLSKDAFPHDYITMRGMSNRYRVDIGEYRIVYEVYDIDEQKIVSIILVGKRNDDDVYKKAKRK